MDAEESSLTKWQLDPNDALENLTYSLKGYVKDTRSGEWMRPETSQPRVNDAGVADVMSEVQHYINKVTPLSKLEPEKINEMLLYFSLYLTDRLDAKQEDFGILDENFPTIVNDTVTAVEIYLRRAEKGKTLDMLSRITSVFSRESPEGEEKKKGFFSIFGNAKGGK